MSYPLMYIHTDCYLCSQHYASLKWNVFCIIYHHSQAEKDVQYIMLKVPYFFLPSALSVLLRVECLLYHLSSIAHLIFLSILYTNVPLKCITFYMLFHTFVTCSKTYSCHHLVRCVHSSVFTYVFLLFQLLGTIWE